MAIILSQITIGDTRLIITDSSPISGAGLTAEIGSMVIVSGQGGIYLKYGISDTSWKLSTVDAEQLGLDLASLDSRLDSLEIDPVSKSYVDSKISEVRSEILSEISRAQAAELDLDIKISEERSRALLVEAELAEDLSAETTRAELAESELQSSIDSEISRAQAAESMISSELTSEIASRISEVSRIESLISSETSIRQTEDNGIKSRLDIIEGSTEGSISKALRDAKDYTDLEKSRAILEETSIRSELNSEITNRQTADALLQSDIDAEVIAREAAVLAVNDRIDFLELDSVTKTYVDSQDAQNLQYAKDYSDQKIADLVDSAPAMLDTLKELASAIADDPNFATTVATHISNIDSKVDLEISNRQAAVLAEETARIAADLAEQTARMAADQEIYTALSAESSARQAADEQIYVAITAEESARIAADNQIYVSISAEQTARIAADSAESSARQAADTVLQSNIDAERAARIAAVSAEEAARISRDAALTSEISRLDSDILSKETERLSSEQRINNELFKIELLVVEESEARSSENEELISEISRIENLISVESSMRIMEDSSLSSLITNEETSRILSDAATLQSSKDYSDSQDALKLAQAKSYTDQKITDLIDGAPGILDTLKEIADQLGDDENIVATLTNTVASNLQIAKDYAAAAVAVEKSRAELEESTLMKIDGSRSMTGDLNMDQNDIINVGKIGVGTSSPETVLEINDNNVRFNIKGNSTSTSGAVNAIISSISPSINSVELVKIMVTGIDSTSLDSVSYEKTVKIKNNSGTVSLGVIQSDYTNEDVSLSSANCSFIVNASDVDVRVTGVNSKTITWKCIVQRMR